MEAWNRIVITLLTILVIAAAGLVALVTAGYVDPDFLRGSGEDAWFFQQMNGLAGYEGSTQGIVIGICVGVIGVMLILLQLELHTARKHEVLLPISSAQYVAPSDDSPGQAAGIVNMEASSVRLLAERTGSANREVHDLRCRLAVRSKPPNGPARIVIGCYPRLRMGSDVQEVSSDIRSRIHETVEQLTGLQVVAVNVVRIRYSKSEEDNILIS